MLHLHSEWDQAASYIKSQYQLNKDLNSFVGVSLYNVNGRLIKKQKFNNTSKVVFKVPKSFSGLYFLNINTVKGSFMKKIIIE